MTLKSRSVAVILSALAVAPAVLAQRVSPHEQVSATIGGAKITIEYGRPYMKGRKIVGGLVPFGEIWRTGADEATVLTTDADLLIGGLKVPKGSYALFTLPDQSGWKLIVNKVAKQSGAFDYNAGQDLGRVDMKVAAVKPAVEQFTIAIEPAAGGKGVIKMSWENTVATAEFSVVK